MYKLKVKKGVKVLVRDLGITIDGNESHDQSTLEKWHNAGLTKYVSKSKSDGNKERTD